MPTPLDLTGARVRRHKNCIFGDGVEGTGQATHRCCAPCTMCSDVGPGAPIIERA